MRTLILRYIGLEGELEGREGVKMIDFMARHDLVDMFDLEHPGMWTWLDSSPRRLPGISVGVS